MPNFFNIAFNGYGDMDAEEQVHEHRSEDASKETDQAEEQDDHPLVPVDLEPTLMCRPNSMVEYLTKDMMVPRLMMKRPISK